MGFDIILESVSEEGLVWKTNFARASQAKICVPFLSIKCFIFGYPAQVWMDLRLCYREAPLLKVYVETCKTY